MVRPSRPRKRLLNTFFFLPWVQCSDTVFLLIVRLFPSAPRPLVTCSCSVHETTVPRYIRTVIYSSTLLYRSSYVTVVLLYRVHAAAWLHNLRRTETPKMGTACANNQADSSHGSDRAIRFSPSRYVHFDPNPLPTILYGSSVQAYTIAVTLTVQSLVKRILS